MGSSDCRKRVAERWSRVDYRTLGADCSDDVSTSSTDIESDDNFKVRKIAKREVIDLTTSDDEIEGVNLATNDSPVRFKSSFKLIKSEVYDSNVESPHFIEFREIFGEKSLKRSVLFSFQYELDFLLEQFHSDVEKIILVAQTGTIRPCTSPKAMLLVDRLSVIDFYMPKFTCHHSKMIINTYDDESCRIFLPSNNFTYAEANYPQQVCWCSPVLFPSRRQYTKGNSAFQDDLIEYLQLYKMKQITEEVVAKVKLLNFEPLEDVTFLYSSPSKLVASGFEKLAEDILNDPSPVKDVASEDRHHYLCQSSTIGASMSKKTHANLFSHLFIPVLHKLSPLKSKLMSTETLLKEYRKQRITPYIIYPTVEEIRTSPIGWLCSGWFHFNYSKDLPHYDMLSKELSIFYKQDPSRTSQNRKATPCHSKFYMKSTTDGRSMPENSPFDRLDWCVYTSSNLSLTAWGSGTARPRNYEVGILLKSENRNLICKSFADVIYNNSRVQNPSADETFQNGSQVVLVPFTLPVVKYNVREGEEAFCMAKDYNSTDKNGLPYPYH